MSFHNWKSAVDQILVGDWGFCLRDLDLAIGGRVHVALLDLYRECDSRQAVEALRMRFVQAFQQLPCCYEFANRQAA